MKALIIIDMQKVSFTPQTPRFDAVNVIARINDLSELFRLNGFPVVFIQHNGRKQNFCIPGSKEWEILDDLIRIPGDQVISKEANDAFYQTQLHAFLQMNSINELLSTGFATDFCEDSTFKSSLVYYYNITLISDAHTTTDRPFLEASKVIDYYNWVWADLIPTEGKIKLVKSNEFTL